MAKILPPFQHTATLTVSASFWHLKWCKNSEKYRRTREPKFSSIWWEWPSNFGAMAIILLWSDLRDTVARTIPMFIFTMEWIMKDIWNNWTSRDGHHAPFAQTKIFFSGHPTPYVAESINLSISKNSTSIFMSLVEKFIPWNATLFCNNVTGRARIHAAAGR